MAWLRLVDPQLRLERLSPARFRIQQGRLVARKKPRADDDAPICGISVLLEPNPKQQHAPVAVSDRRQIQDGIIQYGNDLVIAVENKIFSGIKTRQPSAISTGGAVVTLDRRVRPVAWQALLEALAALSTRGLVTGSERHVIDDILEFTEHHFAQVGSYSTLG